MKAQHCDFGPLITPYVLNKPVDWEGVFGRPGSVEVEIGFGMGEVLLQRARQEPEVNFIGVEQHWERLCKTLRAMQRAADSTHGAWENIRILKADAWMVFEWLLRPRGLDGVYCLFPCPWPKKGHAKHRLFSRGFLTLINNRLKDTATLKIVTDDHSYFEWILKESEGTGFRVETRVVRPSYQTKFEKKWREGGQQDFFEIRCRKAGHCPVVEKTEVSLKSYRLESFDAQRFSPEDAKGDVTVVFKETVYDRDKGKLMVLAMVAEEHLTQYIWIAVMKKGPGWQVVRSDGQNFLATPGIAKALELVYTAAQKSGHS